MVWDPHIANLWCDGQSYRLGAPLLRGAWAPGCKGAVTRSPWIRDAGSFQRDVDACLFGLLGDSSVPNLDEDAQDRREFPKVRDPNIEALLYKDNHKRDPQDMETPDPHVVVCKGGQQLVGHLSYVFCFCYGLVTVTLSSGVML